MKIRNSSTGQIIDVPADKELEVRTAIKNGIDPLSILNSNTVSYKRSEPNWLNKYVEAGVTKEKEKQDSERVMSTMGGTPKCLKRSEHSLARCGVSTKRNRPSWSRVSCGVAQSATLFF